MAKRDTISITIRLPKELVIIEKALCEYKKKRDSSIHHKIME
jgi:hypothetical protein